ncbi:MAG: hypothetical protein MI747_04205 [Desulfobacterales bacterium]|nr:hypothetical protein [Desulfobacterales bacterium]
MKIKIMITAVLMIALTGLAAMASNMEKKEAGQAPAAQEIAPSKSIECSGTLQKTDTGYVLFDGEKAMVIKGEAPLANLVGQQVTVAGELEKAESGDALVVKTITQKK